jgi:uncharacterized protein
VSRPTGAPVPVEQPGPVTVVLSRRARPGREDALGAWMRGISGVAATFPGHLGAEVHPPAPPEQPEHVLVFRFATAADMDRWRRSPERADWLARAEPLTDGEVTAVVLTGLEGWFALPGRAVRPPPRWKTAALTAPVIFVLVVALSLVAGPLLDPLPLLARTAVTTVLLVTAMTWVVMPALTRLLRRWLYPPG